MAALRLLMRPAVSSFLAEHDLGGRLAEIQRRALTSHGCPRPGDGVGRDTLRTACAAGGPCNASGWRPPPTVWRCTR